MARPRLTFFCELPTDELTALLTTEDVADDLRAMGAAVSLGLLDLSAERAAAVRRLNQAGIPAIAWLLLPKEQGYWFNVGNGRLAAARYGAFRAWSIEHGLEWAGIGLDIEPDIREAGAAFSLRGAFLSVLLRRLFDSEKLREAQQLYAGLITQMRADGYVVDSYQLPFIVDERRADTTLLQRLLGILDLDVDREALMLYSSFMRPLGAGLVWSYAHEAGSVALGVTGGGVDLPALRRIPPLTWDELERDLLIAWHWNADIHIFSLEGCVEQDFLARLRVFDWERSASKPASASRVVRLRRVLRAALWAYRRPLWVAAGLAAFFYAFTRLRRRR